MRQNSGNLESEFVEFGSTSSQLQNIGTGVAPLNGLVNHSCFPNAFVITNKRQQLYYCMKPIKAGEQVCTSYNDSSEFIMKLSLFYLKPVCCMME